MNEEGTGQAPVASGGEVDERGTSQTEGRAILKRLRDTGFEGSDE